MKKWLVVLAILILVAAPVSIFAAYSCTVKNENNSKTKLKDAVLETNLGEIKLEKGKNLPTISQIVDAIKLKNRSLIKVLNSNDVSFLRNKGKNVQNETSATIIANVDSSNFTGIVMVYYITIANFEALNGLLTFAENYYEEAENEQGKAEFKAAIDKAQAISNNRNASQKDVNQAYDDLNSAIEKFFATNSTHFDTLNNKIAEAKKLKQESENEKGKEDLQAAIDKAEKTANNRKATQKEVDQATQELNEAIERFKEDNKTNYDELNNKITEADKALNDSNNEKGKAEFKEAIDKAKAIANDPNASQDDVDQALEELNRATDKFKEDNKTNYDELNNKITEADKLLKDAENEKGKEDLQAAIDKAKAIANNPNATQEEIDRANQDLNEAMEKFKKENYRAELKDRTTKAENYFKNMSLSNTPDDGKDIIWFAIQNAKSTLNNKNATAEELHQAIVNLKEASEKFENRISGNSIGLGGVGYDRLGDRVQSHYSYTRGRLLFDKEGNNLSFIVNPKVQLHDVTYPNVNYFGLKILDNNGKIIYSKFLKGRDMIENIFNDPAFKNMKLQENFVIRFLWLDKTEADKAVMYNKSSRLERLSNTTPKTRLTSDETAAQFKFVLAFKFVNGLLEEIA